MEYGAHLVAVIPTHGRPDLLGRTLASVAACARPAGYGGCLVVENGPRAGAEAVVAGAARAHPGAGFRYLHHGRANKSAALNAALAGVPDGALCVFFDDDVRVEPGTLAAYARFALGTGERAHFGGAVLPTYETPPDEWLAPSLPYSVTGFGRAQFSQAGFFLGANWAAQRGHIVGAGGFDPEFGPGSATGARGQEKQMQLRLCDAASAPVWVEGAVVHHAVPPERCSPQWAARRAFQMAVQDGTSARRRGQYGPLKRSVRMVPSNVAGLVRAATRGRQARWSVSIKLAHNIGVLRGYMSRWGG